MDIPSMAIVRRSRTAGRTLAVSCLVAWLFLPPAVAQNRVSQSTFVSGGQDCAVRSGDEKSSCWIRVSMGLAVAGQSGSVQSGFRHASGDIIGTAVDADGVLPAQYRLHQNYPNPFNPRTTVILDMPAAGPARVELYDALGRLRLVAMDGELPAGRHEVVVDGADLPSGVYLYRLQAGSFSTVRRMVLLK